MSAPVPSHPAMSSEPDQRLAELLKQQEELQEKLEAEVDLRKKLERELEQAAQAAKEAKEELQTFIYAASHDLKEPLRSISSYTQLLQRQGQQQGDAGEYYKFILDGVNAATTLIEQLLRLSRAGVSPRRSTVELAAPIQTALYKLAELVKSSDAVVSLGDLPTVSVDESQFAQVFENLIDNAIKYRGGGSLLIEISAEEADEGFVISVKDNGPGIEPAYHSQVFAPFKRLHGKNIPGAGLGLSMSRKIVEAHEGRMWVESDGKSGSAFKFSLPF